MDEDSRGGIADFLQVLELPMRRDRDGLPASYDPDELAFMGSGACKSQDPNLFNTETNHGKTALRGTVVIGRQRMQKRAQIELARSVCRSCGDRKSVV